MCCVCVETFWTHPHVDALNSRVEVCILENDMRRLAPQLERGPLERIGAHALNLPTHRSRSRKGNFAHAGVLHDRLSSRRAKARNDVHHSGGDVGLSLNELA